MVAAAAVLALSPASIHSSITTDELLVLLAGLAVMLIIDLLFLRSALAPLRRLTQLMGSIDPLRPGRRIGDLGWTGREVDMLGHAFNEMLERLEAERRESTRRALAAQESERLRVARELHDELGQTLTAAALRAESAADGNGSDRRPHQIAQALQQSVNEVRRIARELRPEVLDDLGLVTALISMCTRYLRELGGPWIEREFEPDLPPLGVDADLVIYRVAQEALTNAVRHSRRDPHQRSRAPPATASSSAGARRWLRPARGRPTGRRDRGHARTSAARRRPPLELDSGPRAGAEVRLSLPPRARRPATTPLKTRVLLADDHELIRSGLRAGPRCAAGHRGRPPRPATAPRPAPRASRRTFDLAVIDVSMPRLTGLQAADEFDAAPGDPRPHALDARQREYFFAALKAGASGYVLKIRRQPRPCSRRPREHAGRVLPLPAGRRRAPARLSRTREPRRSPCSRSR